jgi:hypothetical protein
VLTVRLKSDILNEDVLTFLRYVLRGKFKPGFNFEYEQLVMDEYAKLLIHLIQK